MSNKIYDMILYPAGARHDVNKYDSLIGYIQLPLRYRLTVCIYIMSSFKKLIN